MRKIVLASLAVVGAGLVGCPKPAPRTTAAAGKGGAAAEARPTSGPFAAALLGNQRSVTVDVMWFRRKPNEKTKKLETEGGTSEVELFVYPNPSRVASVGVAEQFPGGAGQRWKSSVWLAAISAAQALGRELPDYRFLAASRGFVDGPSAGALFTAAYMAAILGDPINPKATMTGTVNPDGTVGLVGGLEEKFLGTLKKGKRLIGYPEGNKIVKGKGGRIVDLENLAAEHGARAVAVRDIYEAYTLLTGKTFPGRRQIGAKEMVLDPTTSAKLKKLAEGWRAKHGVFVKKAKKWITDATTKKFYENRLKAAVFYREMSDDSQKNNLLGAAWYGAVRSATWAHTAANHSEIIFLFREWMKLVNRQVRAAYMEAQKEFYRRMHRLRLLRARKELEAKCKATRFRGAECRRLRAEIRKEELEKKRKAAAAKRLADAAKRKPVKGRPSVPPKRRAVARRRAVGPKTVKPGSAGSVKRVDPPEPPKDFKKLLMDVAVEMDRRNKSAEKIKERLDKVKPATLDEALALISAYEELMRGAAFAKIAHTRFLLLKQWDKFTQRLRHWRAKRLVAFRTGSFVEASVQFAGIAFGKSELASEHFHLHAGLGPKIALTQKRMHSITNQLFAAAKTNVDILEAMIPKGWHGFRIRRFLTSNVPSYVVARMGYIRAGKVMLKFREADRGGRQIEIGSGFAGLGAAVASYVASSKLRWKVHMGMKLTTGVVDPAIKRPRVLTNALFRGRVFALEGAQRVKQRIGFVPTISRILFEAAEVLRKKRIEGQIKAVELYWRAAFYCRLAEMLVR